MASGGIQSFPQPSGCALSMGCIRRSPLIDRHHAKVWISMSQRRLPDPEAVTRHFHSKLCRHSQSVLSCPLLLSDGPCKFRKTSNGWTVLFPPAESCGRRQAAQDGNLETPEAGACLVEHDRMLARLSMIVSSKANVRRETRRTRRRRVRRSDRIYHWREGSRQHRSQSSMRIIPWSKTDLM
jgi:hypothetical protein